MTLPWETRPPEGKLARFLERHISDTARILEVGCGSGRTAAWLADRGHWVTGIDRSKKAIEIARRDPGATRLVDGGRLEYVVNDFLASPPEGPFDVVLDRGFFHNLSGEQERYRCCSAIADSLVESGLWISVIGSPDNEPNALVHPHGAIFLQHFISAAETDFRVLEVLLGNYGLVNRDADFPAWYCSVRRR